MPVAVADVGGALSLGEDPRARAWHVPARVIHGDERGGPVAEIAASLFTA